MTHRLSAEHILDDGLVEDYEQRAAAAERQRAALLAKGGGKQAGKLARKMVVR